VYARQLILSWAPLHQAPPITEPKPLIWVGCAVLSAVTSPLAPMGRTC
jgi:hypothetical protein